MNSPAKVCITVPHETLQRIDATAREQSRSRSGQISFALKDWLAHAAGHERLAALEQLAQCGIDSANSAANKNSAAADHLAEHAKLCGGYDPAHQPHPTKEPR